MASSGSTVGPRHAKKCLRAYADSEGPDKTARMRSLIRAFTVRQKSLDTTGCMNAEQRPGWYFVHAQYDLNMHILRMFKVTSLRKRAYSNTMKISPPKTENFHIKKLRYFSYFCSKHRLWVLVRTASMRRF